MTVERAMLVGLQSTPEVDNLVDDIASAAARARKAEPGDRGDVVRFEALSTQLELLAFRTVRHGHTFRVEVPGDGQELPVLGRDPATWLSGLPASLRRSAEGLIGKGLLPVLLVSPLESGETPTADEPMAPPEPAKHWESKGTRGREAVEERFTAQIEEALAEAALPNNGGRAISPSGIQNPVVTDTLRTFVEAVPGTDARLVPVEYRDGSRSSHPFALRSLQLRPLAAGDEIPGQFDLDLRFALLSIRHTEMDAVVDGAWLRNAQISRPRPAAQTDDLVYDISRTQLSELTSGDRAVRLHLYQTGLETAVVGFYKALTDHLIEHPGIVAVQPMYYSAAAPQVRERGRGSGPRRPNPAQQQPRAGVVATQARFRKGKPWVI